MSQSIPVEMRWVISLLVQDISTDLMVQEGALTSLQSPALYMKGVLRSQLHVRLLQLVLQLQSGVPYVTTESTNLAMALSSIAKDLNNTVKITIARTRPMVNVICQDKLLKICLRIIILLVLLENSNLRAIHVNLRIRSGYVSVRVLGGRVRTDQQLQQRLVALINQILIFYGGQISWQSVADKRAVYLRLDLSNQLNLIE